MHKKIKDLDELEKIVASLKSKGKTVVLCHGVFDLMHPGHIKHFEAAKKQGDVLIVTITPDRHVNKGPNRPVFNEHLRAESISALQCVDYAAINRWPTAVETIGKLKPGVYVKGSDYAAPEKDITGGIHHEKEAVDAVGGRLHFTDEITFSSTELLNKFFDVYPEEAGNYFEEFRKQYSSDEIIGRLDDLRKMKVLIIGDTIIDEYHYCKAMGKSPKESIISTKFVSEERFAGGALACANHAAGFCGEVHLVTCLGAVDGKEDYIVEHLRPNVQPRFFYRDDACTVVKRRFVDPAFLTKMFEIVFLEDHHLPEAVSRKVCAYLDSVLPDYDLVLAADFGHGFLDKRIIEVLSRKSKFLAVNTQTNSANIGFNFITKYPRADYICIDEPEIRLAMHDKFGDIRKIIRDVSDIVKTRKVSVTRGHLGAITHDCDLPDAFNEIPVFSKKIVDRVGAGDAFLSVTSPLVAAGNPMDVAGFVGNAVGALAIGIVCNRSPVEPVPLFRFITTLLK